MAVTVPVNRDYDPVYGPPVALSPLVRRVLAPNPSPFTFHGTGTYLVGRDALAVIDPGPDDTAHLDAILAAASATPITHILITHTHIDHSPLAAALKAKTGATSYGFGPHGSHRSESTAVKIQESGDMEFTPDVTVRDGDVIEGQGFTFDCVFTPGHTSNHMCFALREENAFFPGDHVMGWSTTVVGAPDGDMRAYMRSLEKLIARDDVVYYPTHGAPIGGPHDVLARNPQDYVEALVAHRRDREAQILASIAGGADKIPDMVAIMYKDVDKRLHPAAAMSVFSHLVALAEDGRVLTEGPTSPAGSFRLPT
ncbi:Hydroxyacylglutathione hydrolase [Alphaproteobacteria bacterium SO-S41]|nr:Hydroxyacylglutathione hydrolase [Alphaproteobacteria bacterium SO-S41]